MMHPTIIRIPSLAHAATLRPRSILTPTLVEQDMARLAERANQGRYLTATERGLAEERERDARANPHARYLTACERDAAEEQARREQLPARLVAESLEEAIRERDWLRLNLAMADRDVAMLEQAARGHLANPDA